MKKIYILVHEGFFTQHLFEYQNVDLEFIMLKLKENGFSSEILEYSELGKKSYKIDASAIYWAGSHQNLTVKKYINDILVARFSQRSNLVPELATLLCHENKGMQGILASELGIDFIEQDYHCSATFSSKRKTNSTIVFKALGGAGSVGVSLVKNANQFRNAVLKHGLLNTDLLGFKEAGKNVIRRLLGRKEQADYLKTNTQYVTQSFIENLKFDYKVLVLGEHVYFLKRFVKKGDFRASGSGDFLFDDITNKNLIQFALDCKNKLNVPYCSLDLVEYGDEIGLIEFQTAHFGPYTLLDADCYYDIDGVKVLLDIESNKLFEDEIVRSVIPFFNKDNVDDIDSN